MNFLANVLWILPGLVVTIFAIVAYRRYKDPFHPAVVTAPLFIYYYSIWPALLNNEQNSIVELFSDAPLLLPLLLLFLGVLCLFLAFTLPVSKKLNQQIKINQRREVGSFFVRTSVRARKRLFQASLFLGVIASSAYWYALSQAGGFVAAYSTVKGGGFAESGYIGDAPLLAYPAILFLALSRQNIKLRWLDVLLAFAIASPNILQGLFGGRRGPLYTSLFCIFGCWVIANGKPPKLRQFLTVTLALALGILLVFSQRSYLYFGSTEQFDLQRVGSVFSSEDIEINDYVANIATLNRALAFSEHFWGLRYFSTIFVRPIPRQLWPTKYDDIGAIRWLNYWSDDGEDSFLQSIGFAPPRGSAIGLITDMFLEFGFFYLIALFTFGRFVLFIWAKHRAQGGIWSVIYLQVIILSVYLPSQSFLAFFQRFLFVAVFSLLVWRFWLRLPISFRSTLPNPILKK